IDMAGLPTTAASRVREGHRARRDAAVVAHLRRAGAVLVGKTNLHELAFGITNEDSAFGPARNPRDLRRTAGGSSGGSAVSVAAGMSLASLGTDTGGSIRIPAAACGIVGLKPALGEVSTDGVVPLSPLLDHVGPLARSVADAWLVYRALLGDHAPRPLTAAPLAAVRLAVPRPYFCDPLDDEVQDRFEQALARFRAAGVGVADTEIAHSKEIAAVYTVLGTSDAAAYHGPALDRMPERYSPAVRLRLEVGRYLLAEDYARALNGRRALRRAVDAALGDFDALALPTLPIPAPVLGAPSGQVGRSTQPIRDAMLRETQLFNLTGHAAVTIPCGLTRDALPCGLQLVGHDTGRLLEVALACERAL